MGTCVGSGANLPNSGFGNFDRYPTIFEKAACHLYYIVSGHIFKDGNKRTGYLSTFAFLEVNGYELKVDDDEVFEFMIKIAHRLKLLFCGLKHIMC